MPKANSGAASSNTDTPDFSQFVSVAPSDDRSGTRAGRAKDKTGEAGSATSAGSAQTSPGHRGVTGSDIGDGSTPHVVESQTAKHIIDRIGQQFVKLREAGRSQAWADLERELMLNASLLIAEGMISAKEWISMAIEIESFRKSEAGTQQLPGDYLAQWLSEDIKPAKKGVVV